MKVARKRQPDPSPTTAKVLLRELREECENVATLVRRLEKKRRSEAEQEEILGELSAAVLHLHTHTDGLDEFLCETEQTTSSRLLGLQTLRAKIVCLAAIEGPPECFYCCKPAFIQVLR